MCCARMSELFYWVGLKLNTFLLVMGQISYVKIALPTFPRQYQG